MTFDALVPVETSPAAQHVAPPTMPSAWPAVAADLLRALHNAGRPECLIDAVLEAMHPVVAAVERAGTRIDAEIAWALLAVEADRRRRHARHARIGATP
ncbi:MAG: hypothetical protein ACRED6_08240 [Stellaceae bacterium]